MGGDTVGGVGVESLVGAVIAHGGSGVGVADGSVVELGGLDTDAVRCILVDAGVDATEALTESVVKRTSTVSNIKAS